MEHRDFTLVSVLSSTMHKGNPYHITGKREIEESPEKSLQEYPGIGDGLAEWVAFSSFLRLRC